jgi:4-amino-4-deoxy-L-arabinose transferase-like glycosyltransferase
MRRAQVYEPDWAQSVIACMHFGEPGHRLAPSEAERRWQPDHPQHNMRGSLHPQSQSILKPAIAITRPGLAARSARWVSWSIAILALILRLWFVFSIDLTQVSRGGDTNWLLYAGKGFLDGSLREAPQVGPVFLFYSGAVQAVFGAGIALPTEAVEPNLLNRFARVSYLPAFSWTVFGIANALMGALLCLIIGRLAQRWFAGPAFRKSRAVWIGWLAALFIAIDPIFIIESGNILTESPFLVLLFGGLLIYSGAVADGIQPRRRLASLIAAGAVLGLATLTRGVSLLLPAVLVIDLMWRLRARWKQALRFSAILVIAYVLMLSTWTVYNLIRWNRFIVAAEGIAANIYLGTQPDGWTGALAIDQQLGVTGNGDNQSKYTQGAITAISANPAGYVALRIKNLTEALLQPYNTVLFPGESIKATLGRWWAAGHALDGLKAVTGTDYFWPKMLLYVFHFSALGFGFIGILLSFRHLGWRLVPLGVVGYFLSVHLVLTAVPRYLFPIEPVFIVFAAATVIMAVGSQRARAST